MENLLYRTMHSSTGAWHKRVLPKNTRFLNENHPALQRP